MPQFDLSQFSAQIFWLILCFAMLYLFTYFYTMPRLTQIHKVRFDATEGMVIEGQKLNEEADKISEQFNNKLSLVRKRSHTRIFEKTHELNEFFSQQKVIIDLEIKTQYDSQEKAILKKLKRFDKVDRDDTERVATEITDNLLKSYINISHSKSKKAQPL